jgi:hypothetical protein
MLATCLSNECCVGLAAKNPEVVGADFTATREYEGCASPCMFGLRERHDSKNFIVSFDDQDLQIMITAESCVPRPHPIVASHDRTVRKSIPIGFEGVKLDDISNTFDSKHGFL